MHNFNTVLALAACLGLAGCGGGGGGGTGSGDVNTAGLTISADKSQLDFIGLNPNWPASQTIRFSLSGASSNATYYATVVPDGKASFDTRVLDSSLTSMTVGMSTKPAAGEVSGSATFKLCNDTSCNSVAWSRTMPYRIHSYQIDLSPIQLNAYQGGVASVQRALGGAQSATDLSVSASLGYCCSDWLTAQIDANGQLVVKADGNGIRQGSYSGSVRLSLKSNPGNTVDIPVTVQLGAGTALPTARALDFDASSPAMVDGSIALAYQGGQSPAWTASADKPWLSLLNSSGTGNASVAYRIDGAKLANLPNFSSETARITFKSAGQDDSVYTVTVSRKLPEVLTVSPLVLRAGQANVLNLHGRGFLQLGSVARIRINGVPVAAGAIQSDSDAVINLPPMSAGGYPLELSTASGLAASQLSIAVADVVAVPAALLDNEGSKLSIAVSSQRNAFYVLNADLARLQRFRLANGAWTLDKSLPMISTARIGMSLDQRVLYTTNGAKLLEARDPDSLAVLESYTCDSCDGSLDAYLFGGQGLPMTNDGRIWFAVSQWSYLKYFDTRRKTWGTLARDAQNNLLYSPSYAVAADGSSMVVNTQPLSGGTDDALRYDPASGALSRPANMPAFYNVGTVLSGNGKYVLIGATDYYEMGSFNLVGRLPKESAGYYKPALVSSDGSRLFVVQNSYDFQSNTLTMTSVDVIRSADMSKIGSIALPTGVAVCPGAASGCSAMGTFAISPFDDAIYWAGNKKVAVIPIPRSLMAAGMVSRFKLIK